MFTRENISEALTDRKIDFDEKETDQELAQKLVEALNADKAEVAPELQELAEGPKPEKIETKKEKEVRLKKEAEEAKKSKSAASKAKEVEKPESNIHTMILKVQHDGVTYEVGKNYELPEDLVKEFRKIQAIK